MEPPTPPLPSSSRINDAGHLEVAGCDVVELAAEFGTPLFVYDQQHIHDVCRAYRQAFPDQEGCQVIYASKAFTYLAMCQLVAGEGLSLDVASGGELHIALEAGFPAERIFVHGNANTAAELEACIRARVGHVVVDSLDELAALDGIAGEAGIVQPILLRITPGIEAHTHDFIQTGKLDSKFGFCLADGVAMEAVSRAMAAENLELVGLHAHIGSQIFSLEPYADTVAVLIDFAAECRERYGFELRLLDVGGGLGAVYGPGDDPPSISRLAAELKSALKRETERAGMPLPRLAVEPGRSIVANAGLTVYTVQSVKTVPGVRTFAAVDGGMSDNLRVMLYDAAYEAMLANKAGAPAKVTVTVAGKHCESGDLLVKDARLPEVHPGDILVTPATGAYGYSMANNYNGQPRPAVVFASDGSAREVIRRETYGDLIRLHERLE